MTSFVTDQGKVIFKWPTASKDVNKRVKWVADGNGQKCLTLTKPQKSDQGLYTCETWKGWDRVAAKNISLKIKGKTFYYFIFILLYFTSKYLAGVSHDLL